MFFTSLMRVADRRPGTVKGMADVRADIQKTLEQQERSAVLNQWLGRLRAQAFIRHLDAGSAIARVAEKVVTIEIKHIGVVTVGDAAILVER